MPISWSTFLLLVYNGACFLTWYNIWLFTTLFGNCSNVRYEYSSVDNPLVTCTSRYNLSPLIKISSYEDEQIFPIVGRQQILRSALQAHCFPAESDWNLHRSPWWNVPVTADLIAKWRLAVSLSCILLAVSELLGCGLISLTLVGLTVVLCCLDIAKLWILFAIADFLRGPGLVSMSPQRIRRSISKLYLDMLLNVVSFRWQEKRAPYVSL